MALRTARLHRPLRVWRGLDGAWRWKCRRCGPESGTGYSPSHRLAMIHGCEHLRRGIHLAITGAPGSTVIAPPPPWWWASVTNPVTNPMHPWWR